MANLKKELIKLINQAVELERNFKTFEEESRQAILGEQRRVAELLALLEKAES